MSPQTVRRLHRWFQRAETGWRLRIGKRNDYMTERRCLCCARPFVPRHREQKFCGYACGPRRKATEAAFWAKVDKHVARRWGSDCWIYMGVARTQGGYGHFGGKYAHRYAWELRFGAVPKGMFVLHRCDDPRCVNWQHLFLGTARDNMQDAKRKNRLNTGDRNPSRRHPENLQRGEHRWNARFTAAQVREMRELKAQGWRNCDIQRRFGGVGSGTLVPILKRRAWKHV